MTSPLLQDGSLLGVVARLSEFYCCPAGGYLQKHRLSFPFYVPTVSQLFPQCFPLVPLWSPFRFPLFSPCFPLCFHLSPFKPSHVFSSPSVSLFVFPSSPFCFPLLIPPCCLLPIGFPRLFSPSCFLPLSVSPPPFPPPSFSPCLCPLLFLFLPFSVLPFLVFPPLFLPPVFRFSLFLFLLLCSRFFFHVFPFCVPLRVPLCVPLFVPCVNFFVKNCVSFVFLFFPVFCLVFPMCSLFLCVSSFLISLCCLLFLVRFHSFLLFFN